MVSRIFSILHYTEKVVPPLLPSCRAEKPGLFSLPPWIIHGSCGDLHPSPLPSLQNQTAKIFFWGTAIWYHHLIPLFPAPPSCSQYFWFWGTSPMLISLPAGWDLWEDDTEKMAGVMFAWQNTAWALPCLLGYICTTNTLLLFFSAKGTDDGKVYLVKQASWHRTGGVPVASRSSFGPAVRS